MGAGNTATPNTQPVFTDLPANGMFCVNTNTRLAVDLNASDKDGNALSFFIAGNDLNNAEAGAAGVTVPLLNAAGAAIAATVTRHGMRPDQGRKLKLRFMPT